MSPDEVARTFRCDQNDIQVGARLDLLVVNIEAVCKKNRRTLLYLVEHRFIQRTLHQIGRQKRNDRSPLDGIIRFHDLQAIGFRFGPACTTAAKANDDVLA